MLVHERRLCHLIRSATASEAPQPPNLPAEGGAYVTRDQSSRTPAEHPGAARPQRPCSPSAAAS